MATMYDYRDKLTAQYLEQLYEIFRRYKTLDFDELNTFSTIQAMYNEIDILLKALFRELISHYYESEKHGDVSIDITTWLNQYLNNPSDVLKFSYSSELTRKRDRLVESLLATNGSVAEIDVAMRSMARMIGWITIDIADKAVEQARIDDEVEYVKWVTQKDGKVCTECKEKDGKIYKLINVPTKPHPNCRCELHRV